MDGVFAVRDIHGAQVSGVAVLEAALVRTLERILDEPAGPLRVGDRKDRQAPRSGDRTLYADSN